MPRMRCSEIGVKGHRKVTRDKKKFNQISHDLTTWARTLQLMMHHITRRKFIRLCKEEFYGHWSQIEEAARNVFST